MKNLVLAVLSLVALVGAPPSWAIAADKIRISVTNFNYELFAVGLSG